MKDKAWKLTRRIFIALLLIFCIFVLWGCDIVVAAETDVVVKTFDQLTADEKHRVLDNLKQEGIVPNTVKVGGGSYALNESLWFDKGIIAYGNTASVNAANQTTGSPNYKDGMYRYWGYDINGGLYGNDDFPRDSDTGTPPWNKDWLTTSEIRSDSIARNYVGSFAMNADFDTSMKWDTALEFLNQNPAWEDAGLDAEYILEHFYFNAVISESGLTQGQFVGVHRSRFDGRLYYQTFSLSVGLVEYVVPPETIEEPEPDPEPEPNPGQEIGVECILGLPAFSYEGHPVLAEDYSVFNVNGETWSARRAYEENLADNRFSIVENTDASIKRISPVRAEAIFHNAGRYNVRLRVTPSGGESLYDTKPIDIRNTPGIEYSLAGVQKQNRKQVLNLRIATHPDHPLTQCRVEIIRPETEESVALFHDRINGENELHNGETIKTRPIQPLESDSYFDNSRLEFLTKNQNATDYRIIIYAEDDRGNWDRVEFDFPVAPDHPPEASIQMEPYFIRNPDSDWAEILAEDMTITDGDQVDRTWWFKEHEYEEWSHLKDYEDSSFGRGKRISFSKLGVGSFQLRLYVKDVWTEETLPEYIEEGDYLTGSAITAGEVINVAPTVSLSPIKYRKADIIMLAGGEEEYDKIRESKTYIEEALIQNGIDSEFIIEKMSPRASEQEGVVSSLMEADTPFGYNGSHTFYERDNYMVDEEHLYKIDATWFGATENDYPESPYTIGCWNANTGELLWTYSFTEEFFSVPNSGTLLAQDDGGQYLFLVAKGKTLVLTKDRGSYLTILDMAVGSENFVGENIIYTFKQDGIYGISTDNGRYRKIHGCNIRGIARRIEVKIHFLRVDGLGLYRGIFDPTTEEIYYERIGGNEGDNGETTYELLGIDITGAFIISGLSPSGSSYIKSARAYDRGNKLLFSTQMSDTTSSNFTVTPIYDSGGRCNYIAYTWDSRSGSNYRVTVKVLGIYDGYVTQQYVTDSNGYPSVASQVVFARELSDKIYVSTGAYWTWILYTNSYGNGPTHGYPERTKVFIFNPSQGTQSMGNIRDLAMSTVTVEYGKSSDVLAGVQTGNNHVGLSRGNETTVLTWQQSLSDIVYRYVQKHLSGDKDINALVILDETNSDLYTQSFIDQLIHDTDTKQARVVFANNEDFDNGIVIKSILDLKNSMKNMMAVSVEEDEGGVIHKDYQLKPGTTYYYEYEVKTEAGLTEDILELDFDIGAVLDETKLKQMGYGVTRSYMEDFNDSLLEPFFELHPNRVEQALYKGAHAYKKQGSNYKNSYVTDHSTMRFVVPSGKKAVLSFDWTIMMDGTQMWMADYIKINGEIWKAFTPSSGSGHYTHPELLEEGENIIDFYAAAYGGRITEARMWIDNIRVDLVETITGDLTDIIWGKAKTKTDSIQETGDGFFKVRGSFKTPEAVVAWSAQDGTQWISGKIGKAAYTTWVSETEGKKKFTYSIPSGMTSIFTEVATHSRPRYYNDRNYGSTYSWEDYDWRSNAVNKTAQSAMSNCPTDYKICLPDITGLNTFSQSSSTYRSAYGDFTGIRSMLVSENNVLTTNKRYFIEDQELYIENYVFNEKCKVGFRFPAGNHLIKDLEIYTVQNGTKVSVADEGFSGTDAVLQWKGQNAMLTAVREEAPEEDMHSLVYRKGELIDYSIYYSDYEGDPSKKQYWRYTHLPFNDGPHPDAAVILNEEGLPIDIYDKILDEPIRRFYIDGKYILEHWQEDNTARPPTPLGNPEYDRLSNVETITFYVDGESTAPWVESIATAPGDVKEGQEYSLLIRIDDKEKDELNLTTELFRDERYIFSCVNKAIVPDEEGIYPVQRIEGLPLPQTGRHEVVCTVRDNSGVGIGTYRFVVTSTGKVTGYVNHTDEWDNNRRKYNLTLFGDEFNQSIAYDDYISMPVPRKRGTNVFWSGERFLLKANVVGEPISVSANIEGESYNTLLNSTGRKNENGETIYEGELWHPTMMYRWGNKAPEEIIFIFTADYGNGTKKYVQVPVIMDSRVDYWLLHRLW